MIHRTPLIVCHVDYPLPQAYTSTRKSWSNSTTPVNTAWGEICRLVATSAQPCRMSPTFNRHQTSFGCVVLSLQK